ncbi:MAG: phage major capsid protein [Pontibacterium sp.]
MAFTQAELDNIANAALDYYIDKGNVYSQSLADKPLLQAMDSAAKTFPGGKGELSVAVKGTYTTSVSGYTHNDTVTYANPANIKRANYAWKEHHAGISLTLTELKKDGISVSDSTTSASTSNHSGRDATVLVNLFEDKLDDMMEGYARGMNDLLYGDGTADADALAGIRSIIVDNPAATGTTVGGLSTVSNTWWRNRANVAIANTATGQELIETLHSEMRQLKRFGGKPNIAVCGSDFLDRLADELRRNGNYSQTGFARGQNIAMGEINYNGLQFVYDPALDDLTITGQDPSKRAYIIDSSKLCMYYMDGEKMKRHSPARPADQYVMYRAITTTACLSATQLNCHGVYEIA